MPDSSAKGFQVRFKQVIFKAVPLVGLSQDCVFLLLVPEHGGAINNSQHRPAVVAPALSDERRLNGESSL
jgi:hypothetical protein